MNTLYNPVFEHENCGIGAVVNIDGLSSRKTVEDALSIVEKLEHRAGKDATGKTGDGVGIMVQISHSFFKNETTKLGIKIGEERDYGVGMFFMSQDSEKKEMDMKLFQALCRKENLEFAGWREVPVNTDILGEKALKSMPSIMQCFVQKPSGINRGIDFDRKLYVLRRYFEHSATDTYVASLSSRTITYKGMFLVNQLRLFYKDLQNADYTSNFAIVHSRFSTNTVPSWERAHPNRIIAHNGEINTIRGNVDRMLAREETIKSPVFSDEDMKKILPAINTDGSDSAILDNTLEFLVMNGMPLPLAVMICIPEPWRNDTNISRVKKDFYHYWSTMMESWDGPAAIIFSDGDTFGATLDRNGLRPSRYYITKDNNLILASEVGVLDIPENKIVKKSRLMPGKILIVDMAKKKIISDEECKNYFANSNPYGEWLDNNLIELKDLKIPNKKIPVYTEEERNLIYKTFGWTQEDINDMILPLARDGVEPTSAMGIDIPLAVLSKKAPPLYSYFKQLFAQVTNPPIDSLREKIVTDTTVYLGSDGNLLIDKGENCTMLEIHNPVLTGVDVMKIKGLHKNGLNAATISLLFYKNTSLENAIDDLFVAIDREYFKGSNILILSDRGIDENHLAIPSLLAVSAVEQYLIKTKKRTAVSIIIESGEIRNVHQVAMCLGYGARAVNPYLAHECIAELIDKRILDKDYHTAIDDYNKGIINGVVKISAKMGISTLQSYQSAQIFEAVGINKGVIDKYFTNTISRIEGIGLKEIQEDIIFHHSNAFWKTTDTTNSLENLGFHRYRNTNNSEKHIITPEVIKLLQESVREGDYGKFKKYSGLVNNPEQFFTLRDLLDFNFTEENEIPITEVESVEEIVQRFKTGAMSYGSISEEAHKCLAEAMNTIHGKSNSGEGGEDSSRFNTIYNSEIKQVASGRFGVTEEYLLSAKEIQIKLAQGAKPGEGGHLPGKKVYPWIAKTRFSTPGVQLISPPPHHDIYSIEDLAQLIYDLKNANRQAYISVKLVSEAGVGTIASGVAKAGSQLILISGHDGGTGAAPISSIHHAGLPWEMGLAETHQTLIQNELRSKVRLEVDGKLMTGRDVAMAALLGAEEFGFSTAPIIALGCKMLRVCNLDTCPFGVATQNKTLREKFPGKPEYVINFMKFVAEELREIMAKLGIRNLDEMCGRNDLLKFKQIPDSERASLIDLSGITDYKIPENSKTHFDPEDTYQFNLEKTLDMQFLLPKFATEIETNKDINLTIDEKIKCTNRSLGTIFGSEIQKFYDSTLEEDTYVVKLHGGAGQSFGAFIPKGLTLYLEGDANDGIGKGLSGGKIIIKPDREFTGKPEDNIIAGNVALYGATSGSIFINGIAGERFAVRNSGAVAVVEGCGDHALEYMTGGTVLILGPTGKNLGAGMSGGTAYILDLNHDLYLRVNKEMVSIFDALNEHDKRNIETLIKKHYKETRSKTAEKILNDFDFYFKHFKKVVPNDYKKMLEEIEKNTKEGLSYEDAEYKAFEKLTGKSK